MGVNDETDLWLEELAKPTFPDSPDRFFEDLLGERPALAIQPGDYSTYETPAASADPVLLPPGFRLGVWIDTGGRSLASHGARHAALLHELGFTEACLMINPVSARRFGFQGVAETTIRSFARELEGSDTRITLTSWLRPDKRFIDDLVRRLPPLARDIGARAIELDVEKTWRQGRVRGFANYAEAAAYFFRVLRPASEGLEIAVTCEVDPMVHSSMRPIVSGADVVIPQAYSANKQRRSHRIGGPYGPRGIQSRAVAKLVEATGRPDKPMLMGLAAYRRSAWSGTSANAVLRMELEQSVALRARASILGARYWSWKFIAGRDGRGGSPANRYSAAFLRSSVRASRGRTTSTTAPLPAAAPAGSPPSGSTPAPESESVLSESVEKQLSSTRFRGDSVLQHVLNARRTLRRGSRGEAVRKIQQALVDLGYPLRRFGADGKFGNETRSAVIAFQRAQSISVDGVVGPVTMDRLDRADTARGQTPGRPGGRPTRTQQRVLKTVRVDLPLTRQRVEAAKLYDPATDSTTLRAVDARGTTVNLSATIDSETRARLQRYRQIHPVLARALEQLGDDRRISVSAWIFHEYDLARKPDSEGPAVANAPPEAATNVELPQDSYTNALRASVRQALDRARAKFQDLGVEVTADLHTIPVLVAQASKDQVNSLSRLPEVTGLYLHEPEGFDDLDSSIADARAATAHSAGFKGASIKVGIWERAPNSTADLAIEERFDTGNAAGLSTHAQLVTAIVKNSQSSGSKGFAPDAKTYAANSYSNDALVWAIVNKRCSVVNQSFHRSSEQTDPGMSADDLVKDYLIVHPPFSTIVQAAGNGPATEYVNHKGYNSITVGNHVDGASAMKSSSVFKNPDSTHDDRELPDLSANGSSVTSTGLTKSGTSFASPAVAGSVAVIQSVDAALRIWPEACRAILNACATRNVSGSSWSQSATSSTDGIDGSGALDTGEAAQIARLRKRRNSTASRRGWDAGTLSSGDLEPSGKSNFSYKIQIPASGPRKLKASLAWSSKITYTTDSTLNPPVKVTESKLTADLDLYIYEGASLVAHSSTFDNSFEIVEFDAVRGKTYELRIKRFSGTDWAWYGVAWTVV